MGFRYAILGAGRQGVAAAYDVAAHGDAEAVLLFDADRARAEQGAALVNRLARRPVATAATLDAGDIAAVERAITGSTATVSGLPYFFNPSVAAAAVRAGTHFCDMGGSTERVFQELELDGAAQEAGVSVVPDCGYQPGAGNTLAAYAVAQVPRTERVRILVGGLPQQPRSPLNYQMVFSAHGLLKEYAEPVTILRGGVITKVEPLTELETLDLPGVGTLEAFLTSGSSSTNPWTYEGRLQAFEVKTLRYPGHCEQIRVLRALGLLSNEPVSVAPASRPVVPRLFTGALFEKHLTFRDEPDLCVMRVECEGPEGGLTIDWLEPPARGAGTLPAKPGGFSAMERCTGFSVGIVAAMQARGLIAPGAHRPEVGVPAEVFLAELRKRGFELVVTKSKAAVGARA